MPMPDGFLPTTGYPPGYRAETIAGKAVVRLGCAGDPTRGVAEWTSYREPKLAPDAIVRLESDRMLFGDCYLTVEEGAHVSPLQVVVLREETPAELEADG